MEYVWSCCWKQSQKTWALCLFLLDGYIQSLCCWCFDCSLNTVLKTEATYVLVLDGTSVHRTVVTFCHCPHSLSRKRPGLCGTSNHCCCIVWFPEIVSPSRLGVLLCSASNQQKRHTALSVVREWGIVVFSPLLHPGWLCIQMHWQHIPLLLGRLSGRGQQV